MGQATGRRRLSDPAFSASGPFGGFGPEALLACYARGVFPMAESRDDPRVRSHQPSQRPQGRHEVADFQMLEQIERDDQVEPGPRLDRQFR